MVWAAAELRLSQSLLLREGGESHSADRQPLQGSSGGDWIPDRQRDLPNWRAHAIHERRVSRSAEAQVQDARYNQQNLGPCVLGTACRFVGRSSAPKWDSESGIQAGMGGLSARRDHRLSRLA